MIPTPPPVLIRLYDYTIRLQTHNFPLNFFDFFRFNVARPEKRPQNLNVFKNIILSILRASILILSPLCLHPNPVTSVSGSKSCHLRVWILILSPPCLDPDPVTFRSGSSVTSVSGSGSCHLRVWIRILSRPCLDPCLIT